MNAPLIVDLECDGTIYRAVRVHGSGGILVRHRLGALRTWLARPKLWPVLRIHTVYTASTEESVDLPTERVRLLRVTGEPVAATQLEMVFT